MNRILNSKGFSLAEIVVTLGLVGIIGLGVSGLLKQTSDLKRESQNTQAIDQTFKSIQSIIKYSERNTNCENALGNTLNNGSITATSANGSIGPFTSGSKLNATTSIESIQSNRVGTGTTGRLKLQITVTFLKKIGNGTTRRIQKTY